MSGARFIIGDVFDVLATIPDGSVDLVLTSPPFLALRSYLPADHPDKGKEIGSEPDPAAFIDTLLALSAEWRRVLTPHGSIAVELGDTYSDGAAARWPLAKSLALIPEAYRLALAYGTNPHTGAESPAGEWRVRNVVRWCRPNPPVGALGDKYRPATSEMVVACVSKDRWFDLDAVRSGEQTKAGGTTTIGDRGAHGEAARRRVENVGSHPAGAPPLDWWNIPTHPYPGAHYATWPPALCTTPIDSMCPRQVCTVCGEPRRRLTSAEYEAHGDRRDENKGVRGGAGASGEHAQHMAHGRATKKVETLGWSDCGHDTWRPGTVLDPFAGSGTTLAVATGMGRTAIGIDIDERNADLAAERVGMFLTTERHPTP